MKLTAGMVYDIILMLMVLHILWRGWRQGLVSELLRLAGWVAAIILVALYAGPWAEKVYHAVVEKHAVAAVAASIPGEVLTAMENGAAAMNQLQAVLDSLSGILGGQVLDEGSSAAILTILSQDAGSLAQAITQTVLQPMLVSVVQMVVSLLILIACLGVSRALARMAASRRGDGILSMTNRLLGFGLGIGESLVSAWAFVFVLDLLTVFVETSWLNPQVLQQTFFIRRFL